MNTEIGTETEAHRIDTNQDTSVLVSHCLDLPLAFAIWQDQGENVLISSKMQSLLKVPSLVVPSIDFVRSTSSIFGEFLYEAVDKLSVAQFSNRKYSDTIKTKYNKTYKITLRYNIRSKVYIFTAVDTVNQTNDGHTTEEYSILKEKTAILNEILDNIPIFVWYKNKNSKLLYCNKEYADAQNITVREVLNSNKQLIKNSVLPVSSNTIRQFITDIQLNNETKTLQTTEFISNTNDNYIIGFAQEYSDKKAINKQADLYKQYLSQTIDSISDGIALFDVDNKLSFYNDIALRLFNFVISDVENKTFTEIVDLIISREILANSNKDYRNSLLNNIKNITNDAVVKKIQFSNGRTLRVTITVHENKTTLFVFTDITNNLVHEREIRSIRTVYQNILNNADAGIIIFGSDNRIKFTNIAVTEILKLSGNGEHLLENYHIRDCFNKNLFENVDEQTKFTTELLNSAEQRIANTEIINISGKTLECIYLPLPDGLNLLKFKDLSHLNSMKMDLKIASDKVAQITNLKSSLITTIADEYVAPLSTITSLAEILGNKYFGELNEKQEEYCKSIIKTASYLKDISEAITDIALIKTNQMNFVFNETDINEFIQGIVDEFSKTGCKTISFTPIQPTFMVYIEIEAIKKALYHVISKAQRMISDDGAISISVQKCVDNDNFFEIEVSDNGTGIEATDLSLYQQFLIKDINISELKTIDIGYALANFIVQKHNGKITIMSEENSGTTIKIQLQIRHFLV